VTWGEKITASNTYILMYTTSSDGGSTWDVPTAINSAVNVQLTGINIAGDSADKLWLVAGIMDVAAGTYDVKIWTKAAGGAWDGGTVLWDGSVLGGNCVAPTIAISSTDIVWVSCHRLVGADYIIKVKYYDGGWSAEETIDGGIMCGGTCICIDDVDVPHVVYHRLSAAKYYPYYTNRSGGAFAAGTLLDGDATAHKLYPTVCMNSDGDLFVAYQGKRAGDLADQIYVVVKPSGGAWGAPAILSDDTANACENVAIGYDDTGAVWVAWLQRGAVQDIIARKWNGAGWDAQAIIYNGAALSTAWYIDAVCTKYPTFSNPSVGFALVYGVDANASEYYGSDGLTWPAGPGGGARHPAYKKPLHVTPLTGRRPFGPEY